MKQIVQVVFNSCVIIFIISVILMLNITAPNPTHRRYSSQMPLTTGQGSGSEIGDSAEVILAADLRLPNNNSPEQRQCLCKNASSANGKACNLCLPVNDLQTDYRIPDFITAEFIAESKNTQNLLYTGREFDQISDYALAAKLLNRPLWVYIRVNTTVAPDFYNIVHSTGGNVIPYFTVPGYVDPVDDAARKSGAISGSILIGFFLLKRRSHKSRILQETITHSPNDATNGISRKVTHAEDFAAGAKDRVKAQVGEEDEWNDL